MAALELVQITYLNRSKQLQILRISDSRCYAERVVYPEQKIVFKALVDANVEIYTGEFITNLLAERTLVSNLQNCEVKS